MLFHRKTGAGSYKRKSGPLGKFRQWSLGERVIFWGSIGLLLLIVVLMVMMVNSTVMLQKEKIADVIKMLLALQIVLVVIALWKPFKNTPWCRSLINWFHPSGLYKEVKSARDHAREEIVTHTECIFPVDVGVRVQRFDGAGAMNRDIILPWKNDRCSIEIGNSTYEFHKLNNQMEIYRDSNLASNVARNMPEQIYFQPNSQIGRNTNDHMCLAVFTWLSLN